MVSDGVMHYGELGYKIAGFIIIMSGVESLITMGLIAVSRYIAIVHPQKKHLLSWRTCIIFCVFTWLFGPILTIPALTGYARLSYNKSDWVCTFDWSYNMVYSIIIVCCTQGVTSVIMGFCYVNIISVFRKSKKRLAGGNVHGPNKVEIRLTIQLFVVFCIYNVCWGLYFFVAAVMEHLGVSQLLPGVYGMIDILVLGNSAVNILIYLYYNKCFRDECLKTIGINKVDISSSGPS